MRKPISYGGPEFEAFSEQTREALLQQALERAEGRAEIRRSVYKDATVFLSGGVRIKGIALDVSPLGARIRISRGQPLSSPVAVSINGEVTRQRARIAWHDQGDIGLQYLNPDLSREALIDMLMQLEDCSFD